jgi:hypothetical protein
MGTSMRLLFLLSVPCNTCHSRNSTTRDTYPRVIHRSTCVRRHTPFGWFWRSPSCQKTTTDLNGHMMAELDKPTKSSPTKPTPRATSWSASAHHGIHWNCCWLKRRGEDSRWVWLTHREYPCCPSPPVHWCSHLDLSDCCCCYCWYYASTLQYGQSSKSLQYCTPKPQKRTKFTDFSAHCYLLHMGKTNPPSSRPTRQFPPHS